MQFFEEKNWRQQSLNQSHLQAHKAQKVNDFSKAFQLWHFVKNQQEFMLIQHPIRRCI